MSVILEPIDFFEAFEKDKYRQYPWLILGKGPTFAKVTNSDISNYKLIGLNHVISEITVDLLHTIDIEVVEQCGNDILENCRYLVMPWVPHERKRAISLRKKVIFRPSKKTLASFINTNETLRKLCEQERLLTYNLSTAPKGYIFKNTPVVSVKDFSASAVVNLLVTAGVRDIKTLGVDGGTSYDPNFASLTGKTGLVGVGQTSYNSQFKAFAKTIMATGITLGPLDHEIPAVVYVGTQPEQELAFQVLKYSIKKHSSISVKVLRLYEEIEKAGIDIKQLSPQFKHGKTPFSFQRFAIPALRKHKGRAIYVDSDMQVFGDIRELWTTDMNEMQLLSACEPANSHRLSQYSVILMDCEKLDWDVNSIVDQIDKGVYTYKQVMYEMIIAQNKSATISHHWNDLERYDRDNTRLIHYTEMNLQPWLSVDNPLAVVWCNDLLDAIGANIISKEEVTLQVKKQWIRPSLLYQIEHNITDPVLLPRKILLQDIQNFNPPHRKYIYKQSPASKKLIIITARSIKNILAHFKYRLGLYRLPITLNIIANKLKKYI